MDQPIKKKGWQTPELNIISSGAINGASNPGIHEANFVNSTPGTGFGYPGKIIINTFGGPNVADFQISQYYS